MYFHNNSLAHMRTTVFTSPRIRHACLWYMSPGRFFLPLFFHNTAGLVEEDTKAIIDMYSIERRTQWSSCFNFCFQNPHRHGPCLNNPVHIKIIMQTLHVKKLSFTILLLKGFQNSSMLLRTYSWGGI